MRPHLHQHAEYGGGARALRQYSFIMATQTRAPPRMTAAYVDQVWIHFELAQLNFKETNWVLATPAAAVQRLKVSAVCSSLSPSHSPYLPQKLGRIAVLVVLKCRAALLERCGRALEINITTRADIITWAYREIKR